MRDRSQAFMAHQRFVGRDWVVQHCGRKAFGWPEVWNCSGHSAIETHDQQPEAVMPCPFAETNKAQTMPVSIVHDFADLPVLLSGEDDKKKPPQVGNPIVPGSELPTEDFDENAEDEFREDEPKEKPNI